jgi:hypothetical protein
LSRGVREHATSELGQPEEAAVTPWDPFAVLWLPHEPVLPPWRWLPAYVPRMNIMYLTVPDPELWPGEADRISRAAWALRTQRRRREIRQTWRRSAACLTSSWSPMCAPRWPTLF